MAMSSEHQHILNSRRVELVQLIDVHSLWPFLRQFQIVTRLNEEHITLNRTPMEQVEGLLDLLSRRPDADFDRFIECLRSTNQGHIADILIPSIDRSYNLDERIKNQFSITNHHRSALMENRTMLEQNLILNEDFNASMVKDGIITTDMQEHIMTEQNAAFLDILNRRGPEAYKKFILRCVFSDKLQIANALDSNLAAAYNKLKALEQGHQLPSPPIDNTPVPAQMGSMTEIPKEIEDINYQIMGMHVKPINPDDPNIKKEQLNEEISYKMSRDKRGRALIINNEDFSKTELLERKGSEFDVINIRKLFTDLHFDPIVRENFTAEGMKELLIEEAKNQCNSEAFVLFIMSHGSHGRVYGIDGKYLEFQSDIIPIFDGNNCPDLRDKPKMFFIQACQGEKTSTGCRPSDGNTDAALVDNQGMNVPGQKKFKTDDFTESDIDKEDTAPSFKSASHEGADMVLAYSTIPGYLGWRHVDLGTWFVRCIVYVFSTYAHQYHIMDLLLQVRRLMKKLRTTDLKEPYMQINTTSETLEKRIYFCPGYKITSE